MSRACALCFHSHVRQSSQPNVLQVAGGVAGARKAGQQSQQGRARGEEEGSCCSWSFFEGVRGRAVCPAEVQCHEIRDGVCLCACVACALLDSAARKSGFSLVSPRCRGAASPPSHPTSHRPPPTRPATLHMQAAMEAQAKKRKEILDGLSPDRQSAFLDTEGGPLFLASHSFCGKIVATPPSFVSL